MLKRLSQSIREFRLPSVLSPVFVSLEVLMEVLIPFLMGKLIDNGIDKADTSYVIRTGILLIVLCMFSLWFGVLAGNYASKASAGFAKNLRHDMYHNVQSFSFSNIDKFSSSSLVTRLTTDVTHLQNSYQMLIRIAVRSPIMTIMSLVMAFRINAKLASVFLCVIPFLAAGLFTITKKAHPIFKRMFKKYDRLNTVVSENLRGIRVVKSFVREDTEEKKFKNVSGEIYNDSKIAEGYLAFNAPIMQFSSYTCMIAIAWLGARMIISTNASALSTGDLFSVITYTMQILMNLMTISMLYVMLTMSKASAERICEVLSEESNLKSPENAVIGVEDGSIEFSGVGFSYSGSKEHLCLRDVNLKIESGETVGIIGSTGSSKTSFVQLIPRLYDVTEGTVKVGGRDVREYDLDTLRNSVAMVLQKNVLFSGTIKDNLRWGNENATDEEMIEACKLSCADDFIKEMPEGYDTFIEQGGTNVSGGQKQRICIARSLLKKPKILIMDDSTSAVDTKTDATIRKAMREYIPETTKLIIAQRISSIESADKIIVLDDGKVESFGTHEELLIKSEIYRDVYESQTKGGK